MPTIIKGHYVGRKSPPRDIIRIAISQSERVISESSRLIAGKRQSIARRMLSAYKKLKARAHQRAKQEVLIECQNLITVARKAHRNCIEQANIECLNLSLQVAREVIEEEIKTNKDAIANRIRALLTQLVSENAKIHVNPADQQQIESKLADVSGMVLVSANDSISQGNARITSPSGSVELNWQHRLDIMQRQLKQELRDLIKDEGHNA